MSELVWTPHPVLSVPTPEQVAALGQRGTLEFYRKREERIALEKQDPFRYGFEPEWWQRVDESMKELRQRIPKGVITEVCLGGNRAAKTERAAKRVMQILVEGGERRGWCCQSTQSISVQTQQNYVFKYIPQEWRPDATGKLRKGISTKIVYSQAGGFTEDTFVLPNKSQCWFKYYSQDVKTLEGPELDVVWCDELVTPEWIKTVKFRLFNRDGLLVVTFTPVDGYNATVSLMLSGAETLEWAEAELLPILNDAREVIGFEKVPHIQENVQQNARIFYFHNKDNPYGNYEGLKAELKHAKREDIQVRAYGVPVKAIGAMFRGFNASRNPPVHVIPRKMVPSEGTRYLFLDPCGGRTWFMSWWLVDTLGRHFLYREWPCPGIYIPGVGFPGDWAVPDGKKADGAPGPAQHCASHFGLERYRDEILRMELEESFVVDSQGNKVRENIFERFMDSRYANSRRQGRDEVVTLLDEMGDLDMEFVPTPGDNIDEGVAMVNSMMDYNRDEPIGFGNEPKFFIVEECKNSIYSAQNWTGKDGNKGACKDPADLMRYAALSDLCDVGDGARSLESYGGYTRR